MVGVGVRHECHDVREVEVDQIHFLEWYCYRGVELFLGHVSQEGIVLHRHILGVITVSDDKLVDFQKVGAGALLILLE